MYPHFDHMPLPKSTFFKKTFLNWFVTILKPIFCPWVCAVKSKLSLKKEVPLTLESKNWRHDRPEPCERRPTRKCMRFRGYPQFLTYDLGVLPLFLLKMSTFCRRLTPASPTSSSIVKTFTNQFIIKINRGSKMVTDQFINVILNGQATSVMSSDKTAI